MSVASRSLPEPQRLWPAGGLETPLRELPGVSPDHAALVARALKKDVAVVTVGDVLWSRPKELERLVHTTLAWVHGAMGELVALRLRRVKTRFDMARRPGTEVSCVDDDGLQIDLSFYGIRPAGVAKLLPPTGTFFAVGKVIRYGSRRRMHWPEIWRSRPPEILPRYRLTEGLSNEGMWNLVGACLQIADRAAETLPREIRAKYLPLHRAFRGIHRPRTIDALDPATPAVRRLALDEYARRIAQQTRPRPSIPEGTPRAGDGRLVAAIRETLPFALTPGQDVALADVLNDLRSPRLMRRLLMGDVGSGKTIVALLAMVTVVEVGRQAAMMAPTEILVRQHFERLRPIVEAAGIRVGLLTGSVNAADKRAILAALAAGEINIVFGTQALIQKAVQFYDLGLAVVDEQHRFGVKQRAALAQKGAKVEQLALTATPIPRSLALAQFGDVDVSELREKPPGRQPIDTRAVPLNRLGEVIDGVGRTIDGGARVFWICPLVDNFAISDIAAAAERYAAFRQVFGNRVGLVHSRMASCDKDAAMAAFAAGETDILVATTVIEVGVDVPEATVMVIEHAERFGLAQLHQLRGRVGRGARKSCCLLLYKPDLGETARARIETLKRTDDGFEIAEADLRLRREGDMLGSSQSGKSPWTFFDPTVHGDLVEPARCFARAMKRQRTRLYNVPGLPRTGSQAMPSPSSS